MTANEWNNVIDILQLAPVPHIRVNPLITKLVTNLQEVVNKRQSNGAGHPVDAQIDVDHIPRDQERLFPR
jgi:hypothetical protein